MNISGGSKMTHTQIREDITRIAQGNIQLVLNAMMDMIEGNEEALESLIVEPEVVQTPNMTTDRLTDTIQKDNDNYAAKVDGMTNKESK
jgi:hypothetical protein